MNNFKYMKDYDVERPSSDYPDFEDYEEYREPQEWDLWDDDELMEVIFERDDA